MIKLYMNERDIFKGNKELKMKLKFFFFKLLKNKKWNVSKITMKKS